MLLSAVIYSEMSLTVILLPENFGENGQEAGIMIAEDKCTSLKLSL